jgi:hypothetical protein
MTGSEMTGSDVTGLQVTGERSGSHVSVAT